MISMAKKNQINLRVNDPTNNAVEQFAEDRDYTKAEAVRRVLESRLRAEGYLAREHYGGEESEPITDGGQVIRPALEWITGFYGFVSLALFTVLSLATFGGLVIPFVDYGSIFKSMFATLILMAGTVVIQYTSIPEAIDRFFYARIRWVRGLVPIGADNAG